MTTVPQSIPVEPGSLAPKPSVSFGRNAAGRIILDATSWQRPACTVRVDFTPLELQTLIDDARLLLDDMAANERAYCHDVATRGWEEVYP